MADLGEEAYSSQMKVIATFLRLLEELMRNKQQDLRYGTKTQRRGIFRRMKDFVGGVFKKVYAVHPCGNTRSAKKGVPNGRTPGSIEIGHGQTDRRPVESL